MTLRLGLQLGYWGAEPTPGFLERAVEAERLGYDCVFTAESWGSDVFSPLVWIAAHTEKIRLGTGIAQISARTPAATAMHAITLDHLSEGRVILGLGVSGPQVVEGWYGRPFGMPVARTREYVGIIQQILRREAPVVNHGPHYPLPYLGEGSWGMGKPLRSITHPKRSDLPIVLGAEGPENVALAAEICDGWIPLYYSPYRPEVYAQSLAGRKPGFEVFSNARLKVTDDVRSALDELKQSVGFYVGGMGSAKRNFHRELMGRMGYEDESKKIQELFLSGRREEAIAAVPDDFVDEISLVGSKARIRERLPAWEKSDVTTLTVGAATLDEVRQAAEILLG